MDDEQHGTGSILDRVRLFALIGAVVGAVLYVVKLGSDDWDVGGDAAWLLLILLGAVAGLGLGLVASGIGQSGGQE
jgi:di/tricarboxylate transporter